MKYLLGGLNHHCYLNCVWNNNVNFQFCCKVRCGFCFLSLTCWSTLICLSTPPSAYFTELHSRSERSLQKVLSPLGALYSQNTRLYGGLYTDLRQYYRGSALNLDETLSEFWSRLLERTFKFSTPIDVSKATVPNFG